MTDFKYALLEINETESVVVYFTEKDLNTPIAYLPVTLDGRYWERLPTYDGAEIDVLKDEVTRETEGGPLTGEVIDLETAIAKMSTLLEGVEPVVFLGVLQDRSSWREPKPDLAWCIIENQADVLRLDPARWDFAKVPESQRATITEGMHSETKLVSLEEAFKL